MYVDFRRQWPPPPPWRPRPVQPRVSKRGEKLIVWAIAFNLLMLLIAPIGGATLYDALIAVIAR
jgi:hypothetical protein